MKSGGKYCHGHKCTKCNVVVTDHKTGICLDCRRTKCKTCGELFHKKARSYKINECLNCLTKKTPGYKAILRSGMV